MASALQADGTLPGQVWDSSQFELKAQGVHNGCGVTASQLAESYGRQSYIPFPSHYASMRARSNCSVDGTTVMGQLERQAWADGYQTANYPSAYPSPAAWQSWAFAHLEAGRPVVYETSRAQIMANGKIVSGLHDQLTGARMDAGDLRFHYGVMVGKWDGGYNKLAGGTLPAGVWTVDGDSDATNPVVNGARTRVYARAGMRQFYSLADMAGAALYDLLAVYPKVAIATGPAIPANYAALLADPEVARLGWRYGSYNGEAALVTAEGVPVYRGFADWLCAHSWAIKGDFADSLPLEAERSVAEVEGWNTAHGAGSIQTFRRMRLCWTARDGCYAMWLGSAVLALEKATGRAA